MRKLLLLRHAKAMPGSAREDFERQLTIGGQDDARHIGDLIAERGLIPDLVMFSSAHRTRETAELVAARWPRKVQSIAENALYEATRHLILMLLRSLPDSARSALIVGHNPGIAEIANQLTGAGAEDERLRMAAKYPTSGLAVLEFSEQSWTEIQPRTARLLRFVAPVDLGLRRA